MHDCRHSGNSSVEQGDCSQSSPELGAVDGRHWMRVGGTVASVLHLLPATVSWRADAAFRSLGSYVFPGISAFPTVLIATLLVATWCCVFAAIGW